jgi:hypothetical protein
MCLPRAYNLGANNDSRLLRLPRDLLEMIAKKMGKRARLLCSKLCEAYGPPGALLRLDSASASLEQPRAVLSPLCQSAIRAWRHPHAVRRLSLGEDVFLHGRSCCLIADALPNLLELSCGRIDPALGGPGITPSTTLTSLRGTTVYTMRSAAAFAPNLRSLHIDSALPDSYWAADVEVWGAVSPLRSLQHLEVPVRLDQFTPPESFCAALRALSGLTHLGLHHRAGHGSEVMPPEAMEAFIQALDGLPLLSSLKLRGLGCFGPSLGAALQARTLTSLHLEERSLPVAANASLSGCIPDISAMTLLHHLTLTGRVVVAYSLLVMRRGEPLRSVGSLALADVDVMCFGIERAVLDCLPGLTSLRLESSKRGGGYLLAGHRETPQDTTQLVAVLSRQTRLQHLGV